MLYLIGFEKVGVAFGDMYFHPRDVPGVEDHGAEHGVRLEVRMLDMGEPQRSISGSRPFMVNEPIWRADLLESVAGPVGSHDRTHHHPAMRDWNGGERIFEPDLGEDPVTWVGEALSDLDTLLDGTDFGRDDIGPNDARLLREAVPEICELLGRLIARVEAGELGSMPEIDDGAGLVRTGWM